MDLEDLLAAPEKYEGRYVATQGFIQASIAMCTMMACAPDECCNSCGAGQRLYTKESNFPTADDGLELHEDGQPYRCGGNECEYMNNCTVENGRYWMSGWVRAGEFTGHYLEVERRYNAPNWVE